jgi:hypothetical protein
MLNSDELIALTAKLHHLEDENFILKLKNRVFEDTITFQLKTMTWCQTLVKLLDDHDVPLVTALCSDDILNIPHKIIDEIKVSINEYEENLKNQRKTYFRESTYIPFKYTPTYPDLFSVNEKLQKLKKFVDEKIPKRISNYSKEFLDDLKIVLENHQIDVDLNEFTNSLEASKIIFYLLRDVFQRMPFSMHDFDIDKITRSTETLKIWVLDTFKEYTLTIFKEQSFAVQPMIYITPIIEHFLSIFYDQIKFKDTILELMKSKKFQVHAHSSKMDFNIFNKFSEKMYPHNIEYNNNHVKFEFDKNDVLNCLLFMNTAFSITDYKTHGDAFMKSSLLLDIFYPKFMKSLIEQLDNSDALKLTNIINPKSYLNSIGSLDSLKNV